MIKMNVISALRTIRPEDGTVGLCCCPDYAEQIWFSEVSRQDRTKFELIIERAPHGCDVTVRPWSESGVLTSGSSWLSYLIGGCFIASLLFMLWSKYYA